MFVLTFSSLSSQLYHTATLYLVRAGDVPLARDDLDGVESEEDETLDKCQGCKKRMKLGKVRLLIEMFPVNYLSVC